MKCRKRTLTAGATAFALSAGALVASADAQVVLKDTGTSISNVTTTTSKVRVTQRWNVRQSVSVERGGHLVGSLGAGADERQDARQFGPTPIGSSDVIYSNISFAGCDEDPPNCVSFGGGFAHGNDIAADDLILAGSGWLKDLSFSVANFSGSAKEPGGTLVGGSMQILLFDAVPGNAQGVLNPDTIWRAITVDLDGVNLESGTVAIFTLEDVPGIHVTQATLWAGIRFLDAQFADGPGTIDDLGQGIFEIPDVGNSTDRFFLQGFSNVAFFGGDPIANFGWELVVGDAPVAGGDCPADLNDDGFVNVSDLLLLFGVWGECPGCPADLNEDGFVNVSDLLLLFGAWGECPPGGDATGACCLDDGSCQTITEADCATLGGVYGGDFTDCSTFTPCPQPGTGESCDLPLPLSPGDTVIGNTTGNADPGGILCDGIIAAEPAVWFEVVGAGTSLTVTTDTGIAGPGSTVAVYCASCTSLVCVGSATGNAGPQFEDGEVTWCAVANQVYYIAAWRNLGSTGELQISLTDDEQPCTSNVICGGPPSCGSTVNCTNNEGEPCGENLNGGCNMEEPAFGSVSFGQTICGNTWIDNGARDTDWYLFTVTETTEVTWHVTASREIQALIVGGTFPTCATAPVVLAGGTGCPATATACLTPGTYVAFVGASTSNGFEGAPCPGYTYTATLTSAPCDDCDGGPVSAVCDADYILDDCVQETSLGFAVTGVIAWANRFDAIGGQDTITNIATSYGGVNVCDPVGWAIMTDGGNGPGTIIAQGEGEIELLAVNNNAVQVFNTGGVAVTGSFYVVVWVIEHGAGYFAAPLDNPNPAAADAWLLFTNGATFENFDPENPGQRTRMSTTAFPGVWMLRANQQ